MLTIIAEENGRCSEMTFVGLGSYFARCTRDRLFEINGKAMSLEKALNMLQSLRDNASDRELRNTFSHLFEMVRGTNAGTITFKGEDTFILAASYIAPMETRPPRCFIAGPWDM